MSSPETPVEIPVNPPLVPEEPVRYLPDVVHPAFFYHANRPFVEGKRTHVAVANPLYLNRWLDIWFNLPIITIGLTAFTVAVQLISILNAMIFGAVLVMLIGLGVPARVVNWYGKHVNRQVTRRFRQTGQILKGELLQCTTSTHSTKNPHHPGYWVKIYYTFRTPSGQWIRGSVEELRDDMQDQQLPTPGTPVYVLYFNDQEYFLL